MYNNNKKFADIGGQYWEVGCPFCAGCPELVVGNTCSWQGNGCKYPDNRTKRPRTCYTAFMVLRELTDLTDEDIREREKRMEK